MENKIKMLLAEDEQMLAEILSDTLSERGFDIRIARDGEQALELVRLEEWDVIVSDVMMPRMDGFSFARALRREGCTTPILFLTALSATSDVVKGFEVGGNDFLKKPFAIDELIVRCRALVGRNQHEHSEPKSYEIGSFIFSPSDYTLTIQGITTLLSARESAVLHHLVRHKDQVVESGAILRELWGDDNYFNLRSLNVYISRLRRHLAGDNNVEIISIRGVGYRLKD
ncbi:MAG: response regulator transcription factor [Alistipes sp.]|nr:response regulator transcription factor [Alistipes sp.]